MINLVEEIILPYLKGQDLEICERFLLVEALSDEHFKTWPTKGSSSDGLVNYQKLSLAILNHLHIQGEEERKRFLNQSDNLYQLLILLYQEGHLIGDLIDLIKNSKNKQELSLWNISGMAVGILAIFGALFEHFQHEKFMNVINAIKNWLISAAASVSKFFSVARNSAIFGFIYNGLEYCYRVFEIMTDSKLSKSEKAYELLFKTIGSALLITSYAITFSLGGAMSWLAASFSIAASTAGLIKSANSFFYAYQNYPRQNQADELEPNIHQQAQELRKVAHYHKRSATLFVETISALVNTSIVVLWALSPASIAMVAGGIGAMIFSQAAHQYSKDWINEKYSHQLQQDLRTAYRQNTAEKAQGAQLQALQRLTRSLNQLDNQPDKELVINLRNKKRQYAAVLATPESQLTSKSSLDRSTTPPQATKEQAPQPMAREQEQQQPASETTTTTPSQPTSLLTRLIPGFLMSAKSDKPAIDSTADDKEVTPNPELAPSI